MSHTPGPWHVDTKYTRVTIVAESGLGVAFMSQTTAIGNATFDDARLIAAAPDLLAACKAALNSAYSTETIRAAIAKGRRNRAMTTTTRRAAHAATATVTVTSVAIQWSLDFDLVRLSCGHTFFLETDESNASLVGAETRCEGCR